MKRSAHLNYLLSEYFFSRVIEKNVDDKARFLEKNIILEILNIALSRESRETVAPVNQQETPFIKSLKYIETNLFSELNIKKIVKAVGIGQANLFREFKKHINTTPYFYIQNRRLEEAKILLENGEKSVGEIAVLIGYNNFGAFTDAFKRKFKNPPSKFLNKK